MFKHALCVAALVLVAGCVTPYQRLGYTGGYTDHEESPGVFRVEVYGNAMTDRDTLMGYFKRRIKEVCAENGGTVADWKVGSDLVSGPQTYTVESDGRGTASVRPDFNPSRWTVSGVVRCTQPEM